MSNQLDQARSLLRIPTHRKVASLLEGDYVALHAGRSTEFNDLREYVRGDDPKDLDWKASARARTLLVRRYEALRKLTLMLVVSTGRSMTAASPRRVPKHDVGLSVAGVLGHLAIRHGDLVGLVHGGRDAHTVVPPRGGKHHVERILRSIQDRVSAPGATDLTALLRGVGRSVRRRSVVVLVVDDVVIEPEAESALRRLGVQHEVLCVVVEGLDPLDPGVESSLSVMDVDDAGLVPAWLREDPHLQRDHAIRVDADRQALERQLDRLRIPHVRVRGLDDVVPALRNLLERHRRGGRR